MESLSATVDARDAYTAGHSRRVQQLALAIGRELGLSQAELDLLGHAALFHDIGKLAIPDSILLKPATLTEEEWALMRRTRTRAPGSSTGSGSSATPSPRSGTTTSASTAPAIPTAQPGGDPARRPHHPRRRRARLDAHDPHLSAAAARGGARGAPRRRGTQFCPRCVAALERILPLESLTADEPQARPKLLAI